MARFIIVLVLTTLLVGLFWPYLSRLGFGRLPGDLVIKRKHRTYYFPFATCVILSVGFSALLWWLGH